MASDVSLLLKSLMREFYFVATKWQVYQNKSMMYEPNVLQVHLSIRPNVGNIVPVSTEYCKGFVRLLMPKTDSAVFKNFTSQAVKQDVSAKYPDAELLTWSPGPLLSLKVNVLWKISKDVYMLAYICCNLFSV